MEPREKIDSALMSGLHPCNVYGLMLSKKRELSQ
jgi:hypothetical protein